MVKEIGKKLRDFMYNTFDQRLVFHFVESDAVAVRIRIKLRN